MKHDIVSGSAEDLASAISAEIHALPVGNTPNIRKVRREYSTLLTTANPDFILELADILIHTHGYRGFPYELIGNHEVTFNGLTEVEIENLGRGMDSWWAVDSFARIISGPAWLKRLITKKPIHRWARSPDLWWRRAALVSTVALNMRSQGGYGDITRTLAVCRLLVDDREDMVIKAMSWALRALDVVEPDSVRDFLVLHEGRLAARVKREVANKLETGLKNPRRHESG
jgi:3-methyladenine DNA glycosylase AlkD